MALNDVDEGDQHDGASMAPTPGHGRRLAERDGDVSGLEKSAESTATACTQLLSIRTRTGARLAPASELMRSAHAHARACSREAEPIVLSHTAIDSGLWWPRHRLPRSKIGPLLLDFDRQLLLHVLGSISCPRQASGLLARRSRQLWYVSNSWSIMPAGNCSVEVPVVEQRPVRVDEALVIEKHLGRIQRS